MTFLEGCSIIVKLTAESGRICSLKIEQQKKSRALKSADLVNNTLKKETQKSKKKLEKSSEKDVRQRKLFNIEFFREFDPGSGLTLAACITHSSRTKYRNILSGGRVSNA